MYVDIIGVMHRWKRVEDVCMYEYMFWGEIQS